MPEKVDSMISQLQNVSKTFFNPNRGAGDPNACKAAVKNGVTVTKMNAHKPTAVTYPFFVPWLELPPDDDGL
jgi:hypothetical protein